MIGLLAAALLLAGDLNAPVVDHPTVGSEISRGFEAGMPCDPMLSSPALDACFRRVRDAYRLQHSSTEAYELGLALREWKTNDLGFQARESVLGKERIETRGAHGGAALAFVQANRLRDKLGLSVDDVLAAANVDLPSIRERWVYWKAEMHCDQC